MDDEQQQQEAFERMVREIFSEATPTKPKVAVPAGAKAAVNFFTACATWLFAIALLMPAVWLLWTAAKWMFSL